MKQALEPCSSIWKPRNNFARLGEDGGVWLSSETAPKATLLPWDSCGEELFWRVSTQTLCLSTSHSADPPAGDSTAGVLEAKARLRLRGLAG